MAPPGGSQLELVVNHVVLPAWLPSRQDSHLVENTLLDLLSSATRELRDATPHYEQWGFVQRSLTTCKTLNSGGRLDKTSLLEAFQALKLDEPIVVHIAEQNAALLIRRFNDSNGVSKVLFEAFESSPVSEKVLASMNFLTWDFPGSAASISFATFSELSFQTEIANFLQQASTESVKRFGAQAQKAGSSVFETRDTADPALITQLFMTIIEANGAREFPSLLRKRVRDDVCWDVGTEKPWRRCPLWLVLRVGVQRHLHTLFDAGVARIQYKSLMCVLLARLLDISLAGLDQELLYLLKTKLCRRLDKLESEYAGAPLASHSTYDSIIKKIQPRLRKSIKAADQAMQQSWAGFKNNIHKKAIDLSLPHRADSRHLFFKLPNSEAYLNHVLSQVTPRWNGTHSAPLRFTADHNNSVASLKPSIAFIRHYFSLDDSEDELANFVESIPAADEDCRKLCFILSDRIFKYLKAVSRSYDGDPQQKSIMLLTVMELWVTMDKCAVRLFPLLQEFESGFPPNILDVLQLPGLNDMRRAQKIRNYINTRHSQSALSNANGMTIFTDPAEGCFAQRFYDNSKESNGLEELRLEIEETAEKSRVRKEQEWRQKSSEYDTLKRQFAEATCIYTLNEKEERVHDSHHCTKCIVERQIANFRRIVVLEHPLPSRLPQAKAVVFELSAPEAFLLYRDSTWKIIGLLASPQLIEGTKPTMLLKEYSELKTHVETTSSNVCLASVPKSFLKTHYRGLPFPVELGDLCRQNAMHFRYYDNDLKVWPAKVIENLQSITFKHHCELIVPANSPYSSFHSEWIALPHGPSSNQIIANQTRCPSGLNVHEFSTFQALLSGTSRRWMELMRELGSTNINFGSEATTFLVSHLALQMGPHHGDDPFGLIHGLLKEDKFASRLLELIDERLDAVAENYRETNLMETLLTLLLRLAALSDSVRSDVVRTLTNARSITARWLTLLRSEIQTETDPEASRKASEYALWAALLCRRTMTIFLEDANTFEPEHLQCFIECSITLQENLVGDPAGLPALLNHALVRDIKMVHQMRFIIRQALIDSPVSLLLSINSVWPDVGSSSARTFSNLEFLPDPNSWVVQLTIDATPETTQQTVHFFLLDGRLLVDGKPIGKLPKEWRECVVLNELFGAQTLRTYPSNLPEMTYMLTVSVHGHQIHVGMRNRSVIIRARVPGALLEIVPRTVFGHGDHFDLPSSLIDGCIHWLDLLSGIMEIRPLSNKWKPRNANWHLNFRTRQVFKDIFSHRQEYANRFVALDPNSTIFHRIGHILEGVEYRYGILAFQHAEGKSKLIVELKRLALSFFVNRRNLLQSPQLQAEMDPDQDAGTWYGLQSKIVLREVTSQYSDVLRQRFIIVPIGELACRRNGPHVIAHILNSGEGFVKFTINEVLGRIECPPEPRLLYLKALYHAYTSYFLPDPLTRRTGTEEALHCLTSGNSQPWTPIKEVPFQTLRTLAELTPARVYYPADRKVMQQSIWNSNLTMIMQHDGYRSLVEKILLKSEQLAFFTMAKARPELALSGDKHLTLRSHSRREVYRRSNAYIQEAASYRDTVYTPRDHPKINQDRNNVMECVTLLRKWPSRISSTRDLGGILQNWDQIAGHAGIFEVGTLTGLLDIQFYEHWGPLVDLCIASGFKDRFRLMFLFSVLSFRHNAQMDILRTLMAFSISSELKELHPPLWPSYTSFRMNDAPKVDGLLKLIGDCLIPYPPDERSLLEGIQIASRQLRRLVAAQRDYEQRQETEARVWLAALIQQWPCAEPSIAEIPVNPDSLVDTVQALEALRTEWRRLFENSELSNYISNAQRILDQNRGDHEVGQLKVQIVEQEVFAPRCRPIDSPQLADLLKFSVEIPSSISASASHEFNSLLMLQRGLKESTPPNTSRSPTSVSSRLNMPREVEELRRIINTFIKSSSVVRQQYGADLMKSFDALLIQKSEVGHDTTQIRPDILASEISKAQQAVATHLGAIKIALSRNSGSEWLKLGGLSPCITTITILETLRSTLNFEFGRGVKESFVNYGLSITALQRLLRIERALARHNQKFVADEQANRGHSNWDPLTRPDWLLLEIDANLLIRPMQVEVADATISPASNSNSVLQMNMGEGKTSCIMPMAAAVLANSRNLLRVIVPKPLLLQTAQLFHARLGGLVGRELRHIPFSRKTTTCANSISTFEEIHRDIQASSGVMIALPEHLLSFKLSGLQNLSDGHVLDAQRMLQVQNWMAKEARDILDESDYTLALRTQLIYPSGSQTTVDGHPYRWEIIEKILGMVHSHIWNLQDKFRRSIEVDYRQQGGFPFIFFLRKDAEDALLERLVEDIIHCRTTILPKHCSSSDRTIVKQFITDVKVSSKIDQKVRHIFPEKPAARQAVYLLRGLFVHRILIKSLKMRWNVQYGLHPDRDPMAVPYLAKGTPSEQAEWGHPDMAISLTIQSFYHGGLNPLQLHQSLEHVSKSDDPSQLYDRFSQDSSLPESLRQWNAINVDDEVQLEDIWKHLRLNTVAIDYFLNNFVFPKHAKQFDMKLQASGWDIPLFLPTSGALKDNCQTTGFSGTNDGKRLLPLTINQHDLPRLACTNAEVLTYLLQDRNRGYKLAVDHEGTRLSELGLLREISKMRIRVLIDSGSQILEMNNHTLARAWLDICQDAPGVVYFGDDNRPWVIYQGQGRSMPLIASIYAEDLGDCLVYLDEAHTRGTDLKISAYARGALTLGPGQTKDQTVQAAMRLRQLGTTQAVVFFAPPEVHQSILDLRKLQPYEGLKSYDVICWLLEQTCNGIEQMQPLYYSQGADYCRRIQAALDNPEFLKDEDQRDLYLKSLRTMEQRTLQQLYGVRSKLKMKSDTKFKSITLSAFMEELNTKRQGFQDNSDAVHGSVLQEVEQEREVAFEIQQVREVQTRIHYKALHYSRLHRDIASFAKTGRLIAGSAGYEKAFVALHRTSAVGRKYSICSDATACRVYVSAQFTETVSLPKDGSRSYDDFQRPVHWILWSPITETAVIVIPEEAEDILAIFRETELPPTHLISYASPVTKKMLRFNDLTFYAVPGLPATWTAPTWLKIELGIFGGRLYFEYLEYGDLCDYLDIEILDDEDAFGNLPVKDSKVFGSKPLTFLLEWLAIRRKGQDFAYTPMGYVCQGKQLSKSHPFFSSTEATKVAPTSTYVRRRKAKNEDDDDDLEEGEELFDVDAEYDDVEDNDGFDESQLLEDEEKNSPESSADSASDSESS